MYDKSEPLSHAPDRDFNYVPSNPSERAVAKGGVSCPFPWRLHEMLKVAEEEGIQDVVSWAPHGRAFAVHKPQEFVDKIMTRFFCQTKYASFQRQLNLYGFHRFAHGRDKNAYYHKYFIRGHRALVRHMIRRKIKGSRAVLRRPMPKEEPDFYNSPPPIPEVPSTVMMLYNSNTMNNDGSPGKMNATKCCTHTFSPDPSVEQRIENPVSSLARKISVEDPPSDADDLAFFEGSPFHYLEGDMASEIICDHFPSAIPDVEGNTVGDQVEKVYSQPSLPADRAVAPLFDQLHEIRQQIRQKQAEYRMATKKTMPPPQVASSPIQQPKRVSFEAPKQSSHFRGIPVYKGSYIAV